jgi:hypothetical protein
MKILQKLWIVSTCVMALAACKKSDSGSSGGTGGSSGGGTGTAGTSAAGTGTAGTGTAGAGAAGTGTAGASAGGGKAIANIAAFGPGPTVTGLAIFTQTGGDVTVAVQLNGCVDGKMYPVHIHEGTSCMDATTQGAHWGPARGEGIPKVTCMGNTGTTTLTRMPMDPTLAWTIGGDVATNVVGHVIVAHDPEPVTAPTTPARIGCGVILKQL